MQTTQQLDNVPEENWTYKQIGEAYNLDAEKFSDFMRDRFDSKNDPESTVGRNEGYAKEGTTFHRQYTQEWAERLARADGMPAAADQQTQKAIRDAELLQ